MGKHHNNFYRDDPSKNQESFEGSQEDLDEYIRVSRPSVLVVILSLLLILAAVLVWGFIGVIPVNETVTGLVIETDVYNQYHPDGPPLADGLDDEKILVFCFIDASRFNGRAVADFGEDAIMKMPDQRIFRGKIEAHAIVPISMEEAYTVLFENEWLTGQCVKQNYNWWLIIRPEEDMTNYAQMLAEVTILTEEVAPISFLMK